MADEKEKQPLEQTGSRKWVLIAGGAVALLLVLALVGTWAMGVFPFSPPTEAEARPAKPEVNQVIKLEPVVFNLPAGRKMAYARIAVALGVHTPTPEAPAIRQDLLAPRITDELLGTVSVMSPEELLRPETRTALKEQIQAFVNGLLPEGSGKVVEVYFTEFIVQ
jgi:flagellar basal body-associated protein FliL